MQAWEQFLQIQEAELGAETVKKWLRSLKVKRFDACNLYLEAKDSFQALWFEEHIRSKAQVKLVNGNNKKIQIHLSIANAVAPQKRKAKSKKEWAPPTFQLVFDDLDPLCLFENFVVTEENILAHKLLKEIVAPEGAGSTQLGTFNPIYIYGPGGSGKTHLLTSMAHALQARGLKTIYARAETFTEHVVSAIRAGEMSTFRQAYRNIDVLLIDDVHVFSRKGATQEEFFHTFNTLHLANKQIILTASCSPQELQLIEPRLVSRFEWGIVLPISTVKQEEMEQILALKMQALHFPLPDAISQFLIETFTSNPKALMRALQALVLRLHLDAQNTSSTLTIPAIKTLLADLLAEEEKSTITPQKIIRAVAEYFGIRTEDILGKAQTRECVLPRQLAMHLCRHHLKLPFMKIGELFSRDHSTVMSSVKQVQKNLDGNQADIVGSWHAILKKLQA
jgi:chromosomal replication initiator protein